MYKEVFTCFFFLFFCLQSSGQSGTIHGVVSDSLSNQPVAGATVIVPSTGHGSITNDNGQFSCPFLSAGFLVVSAVGFETKQVSVLKSGTIPPVRLRPVHVKLSGVIITAGPVSTYRALIESAISMRGVANSQEVLRMVPGLFIAQHQGGGKAEQIFLRGFDADHGHDIKISADGIPVNMVSHAHGQGYADSHFVIPETIENASFNKGPYDAEKGDMATAGYLDFHTYDKLKSSSIKLEGGQFGTYRGAAVIDLLPQRFKEKPQSWYMASEYSYTNGYFDNAEHFKRFNLFTKLNYRLSAREVFTVSASTFYSSWLASGQIPERAIDSGYLGYYGALDSAEGGITSRTNLNLQLKTSLTSGAIIKNQVYYTNYHFDLHSNFTFFLNDPVNGDEIRQREGRNLVGYNGSYQKDYIIGNMKLGSLAGISIRADFTRNTSLLHTRDRYLLVNTIKLGDIGEVQNSLYVSESLRLSSKWQVSAGLRFDQFNYRYNNKFSEDSSLRGQGVYQANNHIFSPKISLHYQPGSQTQWYISIGKGFHSNDARVVVAQGSQQTLPAAYAADLGLVYKPFSNLLVHSSVWYIFLQKEFVYAGDGGTVEFSGRTRRIGWDFSARYQLAAKLFFDVDINYAHGRSVDDAKGSDYIPEAPVWSSSAGIALSQPKGWNASFRYRYLGSRPATTDYSFACKSYFVTDLVFKHRQSRFEYALVINNLFNVKWRETELESVTRLKNDPTPVDGISFTPGTKFSGKLSVAYFF